MSQQIFGDILEFLFRKVRKLFRQPRYGFWEQVIDDVIGLWVKLMQEELDLISYPLFIILQKHANINDFTL